jgi:hypothetical protein
MAGHWVTLVCTGPTAQLIRREGTRVRFPVRGSESLLEISSRALPGRLDARTPDEVDPGAYDLVVLGMQEPQYSAQGVRELMTRIAQARVPCLAIMNMPPPPYLQRLGGLAINRLEACYTDLAVWEGFEPGLMSLASPDPQAFRPPGEPKNVLQVGLATNFKAAPFDFEKPTALLRRLERDIENARFPAGDATGEIPVKLKVYDSVYVPLAKWPMLLTGNYRCVRSTDMVSIRDAVHGDIEQSRRMYGWVSALCIELGAGADDLVPFDKYAKAAEGLSKPSSAARALAGGAERIERVDSLVQRIALQRGLQSETLDNIVAVVDQRLASNRAQSQAAKPLVRIPKDRRAPRRETSAAPGYAASRTSPTANARKAATSR